MVYKTKGTCSQAIDVEVENGIITSVQFVGGCAGNTAGIAKLVVGSGDDADDGADDGGGPGSGTGV